LLECVASIGERERERERERDGRDEKRVPIVADVLKVRRRDAG